MHQFQPEPTHKNSLLAAEAPNPPMEYLSYDHKDHPYQNKNNQKLCDETGHPILSLMKSQWKLRLQNDQNFPMERKSLQNKYIYQKEEIQKSRTVTVKVRDWSKKVNQSESGQLR